MSVKTEIIAVIVIAVAIYLGSHQIIASLIWLAIGFALIALDMNTRLRRLQDKANKSKR